MEAVLRNATNRLAEDPVGSGLQRTQKESVPKFSSLGLQSYACRLTVSRDSFLYIVASKNHHYRLYVLCGFGIVEARPYEGLAARGLTALIRLPVSRIVTQGHG